MSEAPLYSEETRAMLLVPVQGYLAYKKSPPSLGPSQVPRQGATAGSYGGGGGSYGLGTPVQVAGAPPQPLSPSEHLKSRLEVGALA